MSYERSLSMAMLPNDHHPGPRCSCSDCYRLYPDLSPVLRDTHPEMDPDDYIATLDNGRAWPQAENE